MDRTTIARIKAGERIYFVEGRRLCECRPQARFHGDSPGAPRPDCAECNGTGWISEPVIAAPGVITKTFV